MELVAVADVIRIAVMPTQKPTLVRVVIMEVEMVGMVITTNHKIKEQMLCFMVAEAEVLLFHRGILTDKVGVVIKV